MSISSKNIASLLDFTVQGVGKWKKENIQNNKRKIISLLEKYFIDKDIVEFLQTGSISRLEPTNIQDLKQRIERLEQQVKELQK